MKTIIKQLLLYFKEIDKPVFIGSATIIFLLIFINYYAGLNKYISIQRPVTEIALWYIVFLFAFTIPYILGAVINKKKYYNHSFLILLFVAPAIFAWKVGGNIHFKISSHIFMNAYWNLVLYYPVKLLIILFILLFIWKKFDAHQNFYGFNTKGFYPQPYLYMLLIMTPLIAAASTQPDFLALYPKIKNVQFLNGPATGWYKLLYELSYGSDFLTIELFFRGFLILAFAKWVGKDAILPMAMFYCTIHFGKPLGECISSFFGGLILGVVTFHTGTIWGGLLVHLGIAWLMEVGGLIGNYFR